MFLKNYTSEIHQDTTISRIERLLVNAGATGIQKLYTGANCTAIVFEIAFEDRPLRVRLPANVENCLNALWNDYVRSSPKGRKEKVDFVEQATRTAWKLVQDWVEVQVSLIQLKQVESLEVFMPYVWDGKRTYYESLRENRFKALLPEKT
jgi:hypothetical protein